MGRYNFEVKRERKRPRFSRGKTIRLLLLFVVVAVVTAAVIYAIIPGGEPENPAGGQNGANTAGSTQSAQNTPDNGGNSDKNQGPDDQELPGSDSGSDPAAQDGGEENSSGRDDEKNDDPRIDAAEEAAELTAKYSPSAVELANKTAEFSRSLSDGTWKKSDETRIYEVGSRDVISSIASKLHTTEKFLLKYNSIKDSDHIELGQRIYYIYSEGWQITISRKAGTLQLDRKVKGEMIPFVIFPCRVKSGAPVSDLVVCFSLESPKYYGKGKAEYKYLESGNPYGSRRLALARASMRDRSLSFSIHGTGKDAASLAESLDAGSVILSDKDVDLLYFLTPKYTPVRIVE